MRSALSCTFSAARAALSGLLRLIPSTTIGRSSAWLSLLTTQTKWPFELCCTARCGIRITPVRCSATKRTRAPARTGWTYGRPLGSGTSGGTVAEASSGRSSRVNTARTEATARAAAVDEWPLGNDTGTSST